ncbi:MAG: glycoside hydrolase family 25 protein [Oscillospiraceae bacterium]|nr:glycoside hydrolase family 25 protein [Oscillospiraceae bacterium]
MNTEKKRRKLNHQGTLLILLIAAVMCFTGVLWFLVKLIAGGTVGVIAEPGECTVPNINVTFSKYKTENFYSLGGLKYYKDGEKKSRVGIDVSYAQKEIDWNKVKDAGIDFAMIRAGFRGYESGLLNTDDYFEKNMKGALAAGIETGVYFFSQAVNEKEAREEAEFVLNLISNYNVTYPVAFDWETISGDAARSDGITGEILNKCALEFCSTIENAGYKPVIYASLNLLRDKFDKYSIDVISEYDLWLAEYKDVPEYPYHFKMWQYTNEGVIDGISKHTDLNIFFE